MFFKQPSLVFVTLGSLTGLSDAFWRMSCSIVQTGRIDPIIVPGEPSAHVHKIAGASNIGLSSTYDDLQTANCTSCEIKSDKSAYWTPLLYYQHSNGSFEEVPNSGMAVYYLGRGDDSANIKPFPPGFRMVSGDAGARSYNTVNLTYENTRPIADRVSFACLDTNPMPETPGMSDTSCKNGLRAQVHFQSCWDGVNLYKEDNSHVDYMSGMDNGACSPNYPVQLIHIFYEVLYGVSQIDQDGGEFVFSQGDPTGYGFHGDFLNGWDTSVLTAAIGQCANTNDGAVQDCAPLNVVDDQNFSNDCPAQPELINEPTRGMISKLPGCITITPGPQEATAADMECGATSGSSPTGANASGSSAAPVRLARRSMMLASL